ncbi:unnamed protein product [Ixodes persulcatus]
MDAKHLLDFMPQGFNRLILHLGTNDLATANISLALTRYRNLLRLVREQRPDIVNVSATSVLPLLLTDAAALRTGASWLDSILRRKASTVASPTCVTRHRTHSF